MNVFYYLRTKRLTLPVIGVGFIVLGILLVVASSFYHFSEITQANFHVYIVNGRTVYLQKDNTSTYYVINISAFTPSLNANHSFSVPFTFSAQTSAHPVNVSFTDGNGLSGTGYTVEQVTVYDSKGQNSLVYATSEYTQYQTLLDTGTSSFALGVVLAAVGLFLLLRAYARATYQPESSNRAAMSGLIWSLVGVFIPLASIIGLIQSISGLRSPTRRAIAVAGIVIASLVIALYVVIIVRAIVVAQSH